MMSDWSGGFIEWIEEDRAYLSVVFSWQMQKAYQRAIWLSNLGYEIRVGGPAIDMRPDYMRGVAKSGGKTDALSRHNPNATFTSRGCPRRCEFCVVPKIEGGLVELDDWPIRPTICDNNLLACSKRHFDAVIDKLKGLNDIDFNQGLDARLLTNHHADRLSELDTKHIRLAWDNINSERFFLRALQRLMDAGFKQSHVRVYVLIGFDDTPDDALYRLETIKKLGARPAPMRYQPLDAVKRNSYVGSNWTERELKTFVRYWFRQKWLEHVPFEEYKVR